uniref:(northern house mosquito) hypothetical protein n=1 Tax=Culex pipiens TaxID=7175 RepID=A0A8D8BJF0_CULPI
MILPGLEHTVPKNSVVFERLFRGALERNALVTESGKVVVHQSCVRKERAKHLHNLNRFWLFHLQKVDVFFANFCVISYGCFKPLSCELIGNGKVESCDS